ncbi:MAG: GGDEF domain-containing protein, partial [bacterium]|nr:GGDEF domain-containing protein [bacterium]
LYIGPIIVGMVLETMIPGLSISGPCLSISIAGVLASLQNETIYRDQLTGLYNRNYLNYLQKNMLSKESSHFTGVFLDMNDFKHINDEYGHAKGDIALQQMATLLKEAIGDMGIVLRYAGDEFIIIINSHKQIIIDACIEEINKCIDRFNESKISEYKLSASMGYSIFKPKEQSVDDFMNVIDQKMYEEKKRYHNID